MTLRRSLITIGHLGLTCLCVISLVFTLTSSDVWVKHRHSPKTSVEAREQLQQQQLPQQKQMTTTYEEIPLCLETSMDVRDILNMAKYTSLCNVHEKTRLPPRLPSTKSGISQGIASMVEHPHAGQCSCPRQLRLADFPLPITNLLTFPGSGTSWTRHLVQQMTGIHSGSVYKTSEEKFMGFPYEGVVHNVSVVKNHRVPAWDGSHSRKFYDGSVINVCFDQILLLLRNPFHAFVADFKRYQLGKGKVGNTYVNTTDSEWKKHFKGKSKIWGTFVKEALNTSLPVLVMYFEDMRSCLLPELVRIASYLETERLRDFSFCCSVKEHEGSFHRPASKQTVEEIYSSEERAVLNQHLLTTASGLRASHPDVAKRILGYMMP